MILLLTSLMGPGVAHAATLDAAFDAAARRHGVPSALLEAMAWEATRLDPQAASHWGGYGLFDLREDDETEGPGIEQVSALLGVSPDALRAQPALQIEGAAALLAWHARAGGGGALPDPADLEAWSGALVGFSGQHDPRLQARYVEAIYDIVEQGFVGARGALAPRAVDRDALALPRVVSPPLPDGDYSGIAQFVPASTSNYSNYSRGAGDVDYIVIHTVQGSYNGCISWFQNPSASVSAHYVVRSSDGQITQMVREEDVAWHAGNWDYNLRSVGIEHEGYVSDPGTWYTQAMYESSARLSADVIARHGIPADRAHVIAHYEVPGATHTDPGTGWDWGLYMDLIDGGSLPAGQLQGVVAEGDIYSGARIAGARVVLDQTGEVTTTDASGMYAFDGIVAGTWSVTATADGYEAGACTREVESSSGTSWCSVALQLADDEPEPEDSEVEEPIDTDDAVIDDPVQPVGEGDMPGARVPVRGLGCASAPATGLAAWWLVGLALVRRRGRR